MSKRLVAVMIAAAFGWSAARAEDAPKRPWTNAAELGFVMTTGNSQTMNFALGDKFGYAWPSSELTVEAAAVRAKSTARVFTNTDGVLAVDEVDTTTTEMYTLAGKYRHNISDRFYWYTGAGWLRNKPTGIDSRLSGGGGLGYRFLKDDAQTLMGEFGVDYTSEKYVDLQANGKDSSSFAGARGFLGYERKIGAASKFNGELEVLENLKDTGDLRSRALFAVTASLTQKVALKAGWTLLYDKMPATKSIPETIDINGTPDPAVVYELDKLDTILTASLVINF